MLPYLEPRDRVPLVPTSRRFYLMMYPCWFLRKSLLRDSDAMYKLGIVNVSSPVDAVVVDIQEDLFPTRGSTAA